MQTDEKCPRCGTDLTWIPPNSRWLGHNECQGCFLAYHHEIETVIREIPAKVRMRWKRKLPRYIRRPIAVLVQGMIPREKIRL